MQNHRLKSRSLLVLLLLLSLEVFASVEVLFHPYDSTLKKAGEWIRQAQAEVSMIMYNIDATDDSPVVIALKDPQIQSRLRSGQLKIRLIYQGSGDKAKAIQKMQAFEQLGVDCRFLGSSLNLHHKFALIDLGLPSEKLISGSANWTVSSMRNYSENILYISNEHEIANQYAIEFHHWWNLSKEFGLSIFPNLALPQSSALNPNLFVKLNSVNFQGTKVINKNAFVLARQLVSEIDRAKSEILIATTRIKLRPVFEALIRAAHRGVQIYIVVSMDEFEYPKKRQTELPGCAQSWSVECSEGKNYSDLLAMAKKSNLPLELRVKFYNLNTTKYITNQMHSKYMIVDRARVISGSYNWSVSAENGHVENMIIFSGSRYPEALRSMVFDFSRLWALNRDTYLNTKNRFFEAAKNSKKISCFFEPETLTFQEIDQLLSFRLPDGSTISASSYCN